MPTLRSRSTMPPVGLAGEFRITSFVRGVTRSASCSAVNAKPSSSRIGSGTGTAPAQRMTDS